jgi:hypothetical protein
MIRRAVLWGAVVACAATAAMGCSDDEREECARVDEGEFFFTVQSLPAFPIGPDSLANLQVTLAGAVVDSVAAFPGFDPPTIFYRFHAPGYSRIDIRLDDLLLDTSSDVRDRGLPVAKGDTLTLTLEQTRRLTPPSMAIRLADAGGLRYLGVNDWRPSGDPDARVMRSGYGVLGDDGELDVFLIDTGCPDRSNDPVCYFEIRNYRIDFSLGDEGVVELYNQGDRTFSGWRFHVHKAARVIATTSCDGLLRQNAVSFFVEREGVRSP